MVLCVFSAFAHPVIYKDGWVYWATLTSYSNKQRISYTVHPRFAIEINTEGSFHTKKNPYRDYKIGINTLLKRWYLNNSQGNIYLSFHGGFYYKDKIFENSGYVLHPQIELDWESRKLYTALRVSMAHFEHVDHPSIYHIMYRIGVAPYIVGMKKLQTWFVFQLNYTNSQNLEKEYLFTPLLRFFYRNTLWETGVNLNGSIFFTLMLHY